MTDQTPNEVTIVRVFDAPREIVFRAFTDSSLLAKWWSPKYFTIPFCEVDARPGGAFLVHMLGPDGVVYPNKGVFREIVEPERIVFTSSAFENDAGIPELEVLNTITLADMGGKTRLTLHAVVLRATPAVAGALAGMEEGWSQSFDKLANLLSGTDEQAAPDGKNNMAIYADDREIVMTRVFNASRELVFQVITDPKLLPQWWGPRGLTTVVERMDLRPGGVWRYVQHDDNGNEYAFNGVYREITPPERLVYTFEYEGMPGHGMLETVTLEERDGLTTMVTTDRFQSSDDLVGMLQSGMEEGAVASFDRLTELLEAIQKEPREEQG